MNATGESDMKFQSPGPSQALTLDIIGDQIVEIFQSPGPSQALT